MDTQDIKVSANRQKKVDIVTYKSINPYIKKYIKKEEILFWDDKEENLKGATSFCVNVFF